MFPLRWPTLLNLSRVNSIEFKVSVLYTVVLGIILIIFSSLLYVASSYYLRQEIDKGLRQKAEEIITTIDAYTEVLGDNPNKNLWAVQKALFYDVPSLGGLFNGGKMKQLDDRWLEISEVLGLKDYYISFLSEDRKNVVFSSNFPMKLSSSFLEKANASVYRKDLIYADIPYKKNIMRVVTVPYIDIDHKKHLLQIGVSQKHLVSLLRNLLRTIVIGIPVVLVLTSFVGRIFVQRILDPIEEIAQTANQITHEDLSSRVESNHLDVEIKYLVDSFNDMIRRLDQSFRHINEFSSHVAHELKTPLAIIRGESELALCKERSVKEYQQTIRINLQESDRMLKTIEDLLLLAKLDYQPDVFKFQSFNFIEFFQEIGEQAKILAMDKKLTVKVSVPKTTAYVYADQLHLRRLFFNLIDNALKFTPSPGTVHLRVECFSKEIHVFVSDTGVGIDQKDLPKIFEKFYQGSQNSQLVPMFSNGLGLNIVQSIAKVHKGKILVESQPRLGTTFKIILPIHIDMYATV